MRTLRIAELDPCPQIDSFVGEVTRVSGIRLDRYCLALGVDEGWVYKGVVDALRTPPEQGGLEFPIATLEEEGREPIRAYGLRAVIEMLKGICPSYAATRTIKRADSAKMKRIQI